MKKIFKYEYLAYFLLIIWGITFFAISNITIKENFEFMNKVNFIFQFLEILCFTFLNIVNRQKRKWELYLINILLIAFFVCIFFLPMWGEKL